MSSQVQIPTDASISMNPLLQQTNNIAIVNSPQVNVTHSMADSLNENAPNATVLQPIDNNDSKRALPNSEEDWKSFEQKIAADFNESFDDSSVGCDDLNEQSDSQINKNKKCLQASLKSCADGDTAFQLTNYLQAVVLYTDSITSYPNHTAYLNRAKTYFNLAKYDECIEDCSQALEIIAKDVQALLYRAKCYIVNEQFKKAKQDLDIIFTIDPDHEEAQNLLNHLSITQDVNSISYTNDNNNLENQPLVTANVPVRLLSPKTDHGHISKDWNPLLNLLDHYSKHADAVNDFENNQPVPYYFDPIIRCSKPMQNNEDDDDDDDMILGDEAASNLPQNLSDEEGPISRSANVSPNDDNDSDIKGTIDPKPLEPSLITSGIKKPQQISGDNNFTFPANVYQHGILSKHHNQNNDDGYDSFGGHTHALSSTQTNVSHRQTTNYPNSLDRRNDSPTESTTIDEDISKSQFGPTIQSWLHDLARSQTCYYRSSVYNRLWSKSSMPWSLTKIQSDIDKFSTWNNYTKAIDVSKKLLHNGLLDYHQHAEYIVNSLKICAQCYIKLNDNAHAIQYATEALQYNRNDGDSFMYRAEAFENENLLLLSYVDYERVPSNSFNYYTARRLCDKIETELNSTEGNTWREKLPNNQNDDEVYLNYLKLKDNYTEENIFQWYQTHADRFYGDGCFVLAIQFYTKCIELQSNITDIYIKRAACYLSVFEPKKAIHDCDVVLKENENNFNALYYKASAHKMSNEYRLHELALEQCVKLQPHNQIVLAEYYSSQHEQIPRKKRRIRSNPPMPKSLNENSLSYEQLETIRLDSACLDASLYSNDIKDQCSFVLHSSETDFFQSFDFATTNLIETVINICHIMIQAEKNYQQEHKTAILPFSYTEFCFRLLSELTKLARLDIAASNLDNRHRVLLIDLLSYYSSISSIFNHAEQLNLLRQV